MSIHKNLQDVEVRQIFTWYQAKVITRTEAQLKLNISKSQFYDLLKRYKAHPKKFTIAYQRTRSNNQLPATVVASIKRELEIDQRLINNPNMPIMFHNYSSVRDTVESNTGHSLSAQTVINYAKRWGYYLERPKKKAHTREVITDYTGMLLQHDSSHHQWSPYAIDAKGKPIKWILITTLDDHSRKILYAELFERETAWAHIQALEAVVLKYGIGITYYSDNHSIFRYVANRDQQIHLNRVLGTDDVAPQWKRCVEATGMKVSYALSPEAKGKVERPYRWLQDRIVRRAARQNARNIDEVRSILYQEIDRYNNRQVHSTTKEVPEMRFQRAANENRSCFRPLNLKQTVPPVASTKDLFCLRDERKIDGYGQISFCGSKLSVPGNLPDGTTVTLHVIPGRQDTNLDRQDTEIRFLKNNLVLGYSMISPLPQFRF